MCMIFFVFGHLSWYSHTEPIFLHLKVLKLDEIRNYQVGLFMYRLTREVQVTEVCVTEVVIIYLRRLLTVFDISL